MLTGELAGALAATLLAALLAVPVVLGLLRLPPPWAAALGALCLLPAVLPLPFAAVPARALAVLPFVALPAGWGLGRIPRGAGRIAATLAPPQVVFRLVWLPQALPWLAAALAFGLARALVDAGLPWPAAPVLLAGAWPVLRALLGR